MTAYMGESCNSSILLVSSTTAPAGGTSFVPADVFLATTFLEEDGLGRMVSSLDVVVASLVFFFFLVPFSFLGLFSCSLPSLVEDAVDVAALVSVMDGTSTSFVDFLVVVVMLCFSLLFSVPTTGVNAEEDDGISIPLPLAGAFPAEEEGLVKLPLPPLLAAVAFFFVVFAEIEVEVEGSTFLLKNECNVADDFFLSCCCCTTFLLLLFFLALSSPGVATAALLVDVDGGVAGLSFFFDFFDFVFLDLLLLLDVSPAAVVVGALRMERGVTNDATLPLGGMGLT